jgi:hypothetical protein
MKTEMHLESVDYDLFDYKRDPDQALSLEEAIKKSDQLRRSDPKNFYRVHPVDMTRSAFWIEEVPKQRAYLDAVARWSSLLNKLLFKK